MSETKININERIEGENKVPDEELMLPADVYDANWRDDIPEEVKEENEAIDFEPFEDEQEYKSREVIGAEAENLIGAFERAKLRDFGGKTLRVYRKTA